MNTYLFNMDEGYRHFLSLNFRNCSESDRYDAQAQGLAEQNPQSPDNSSPFIGLFQGFYAPIPGICWVVYLAATGATAAAGEAVAGAAEAAGADAASAGAAAADLGVSNLAPAELAM